MLPVAALVMVSRTHTGLLNSLFLNVPTCSFCSNVCTLLSLVQAAHCLDAGSCSSPNPPLSLHPPPLSPHPPPRSPHPLPRSPHPPMFTSTPSTLLVVQYWCSWSQRATLGSEWNRKSLRNLRTISGQQPHTQPIIVLYTLTALYNTINQSINQSIYSFSPMQAVAGIYTDIYIIPIGLGTIANVTVLQFCIYNYNLLSQVIFPSFPRSSSWSLSWHFLHIHSLC